MTEIKLYINTKPCKEPHLICDDIDLTEQIGIHYYEDEIGYYEIYGELEINNT